MPGACKSSIDALPDATGSLTCEGSPAASQIAGMSYHAFSNQRPEKQEDGSIVGHDVLLLVDMSGSMKGFVDKNSNLEYPVSASVELPTDLTLVASDYYAGHLDLVRQFVDSLNTEDRYGIVAFGEGLGGEFMTTACSSPEVAGTLDHATFL